MEEDEESIVAHMGGIRKSAPVRALRRARAVRKVLDSLDVHCDMCGKRMRPGGVVKRKIGRREYQFCSKECADLYDPKWDIVTDF